LLPVKPPGDARSRLVAVATRNPRDVLPAVFRQQGYRPPVPRGPITESRRQAAGVEQGRCRKRWVCADYLGPPLASLPPAEPLPAIAGTPPGWSSCNSSGGVTEQA